MHSMYSGINISQTDARPMYLQIMEQIRARVAAGDWPSGKELPSIRALAAALSVSVITVKRAYLEMEHAGLIVTQHGKGSFVAADVVSGSEIFEQEMLGHLEEAARLATSIGMSEREIVSRLRKALDETDDTRLTPRSSKESQ